MLHFLVIGTMFLVFAASALAESGPHGRDEKRVETTSRPVYDGVDPKRELATDEPRTEEVAEIEAALTEFYTGLQNAGRSPESTFPSAAESPIRN